MTDYALNVTFDNVASGLTATEVQSAIDELAASTVDLTTDVTGILPLANGGTNDAAVTSANIGHLKAMDQDVGTGDDVVHEKITSNDEVVIFNPLGAIYRARNTDTTLVNGQLIGGYDIQQSDTTGAGPGTIAAMRAFSASSSGSIARLAFMIGNASTLVDVLNFNFLLKADFEGDISVTGTAAIITSGSGSPEGVKTATIGSVFSRTDGGAGTSRYKKESGTGNTGWVAF